MSLPLDLRGATRDSINRSILSGDEPPFLILSAYQTQWIDLDVAESRHYVAVVPDYLHYARLLSTARFQEFLDLGGTRLESARALALAGLRSAPALLGLLRLEFWSVARLLLLHDISMLSGWFKGRVVLHPYLTDLAVAAGRGEFLRDWLTLRRSALIDCNRGVWTRRAPATLSLLAAHRAPCGVFVYDELPRDDDTRLAVQSAKADPLFHGTEFIGVPCLQ
ncbi:MAG TPA: hypothetical protein VL588_04635 [Bdellovibrionota bacterium]|jgi:hypothetical protein|nr:hypothetical protein [Bdellovibrionota bacterium]